MVLLMPLYRILSQPTLFRVVNSNRNLLFNQCSRHSVFCLQSTNHGKLAGHSLLKVNCQNDVLHISRNKYSSINVHELKLPHKYWRWWHRLYIYWHFGSTFNNEDFFEGVIQLFLFTSECITNGNISDLDELITSKGFRDIPFYMSHALSVSQEPYFVEETDIVYLHVRSTRISAMEQFDEHRNVKVMACTVWITYVRNFRKKLAEKALDKNDSTLKEHTRVLREVSKDLFGGKRIAVYEFQRVYDQTLENALSEWMVSGIQYHVPELMK